MEVKLENLGAISYVFTGVVVYQRRWAFGGAQKRTAAPTESRMIAAVSKQVTGG